MTETVALLVQVFAVTATLRSDGLLGPVSLRYSLQEFVLKVPVPVNTTPFEQSRNSYAPVVELNLKVNEPFWMQMSNEGDGGGGGAPLPR